MSGTAEVRVAGTVLRLLPERAIHWPEADTLFIADPHFGKAAAFRAAGLPVPGGTTAAALARLGALLQRTAAGRLVILGDFLHARTGRAPGTMQALQRWRDRHAALELLLVRGNHDRHAGDPPPGLGARVLAAPVAEPPFVLVHHPRADDTGYVLAGHLHPAVRLTGPGRLRARLPCFWFGARTGVLPAFGEFTGAADVDPVPGDRLFVVAGDAVVEVAAASPR